MQMNDFDNILVQYEEELDGDELIELGRTIKAAFDLKEALDWALDCLEKGNEKGALAALNEALEGIRKFGFVYACPGRSEGGYGYGDYPTPKQANTREIQKLIRRAITALEEDDVSLEKAKSAVVQILVALGCGYPYPASGGDAQKRLAPEALEKLEVKTLREEAGGLVVGGYLLLWGTPQEKDLVGDYFTPETYLALDVYGSVPTLFHHGLDEKVGLEIIGHRLKAAPDKIGVWVEEWIDGSKKRWAWIERLLKMGKLYFSPGSAPHLVRRADDGKLLNFPVIDDTLTPIPAQPRLRSVAEIRAIHCMAGLPWQLGKLTDLDIAIELKKFELELAELKR